MYRQYKVLPEANRICMRASRERAYQQHLFALKKMKPSINNKKPNIPQTIGRNYKRYEMEKQRYAEIARDNNHILKSIETYQNQEHFPRNTPQRPFTLQGKAQKDEMSRITYENHKLLSALQDKKPFLNRNDWLKLKLDHQYQINKMSEYKKTVPMSKILRQEKSLTSNKKRPQTNLNNSSNLSTSDNRSKSSISHTDLEKENQERIDSLVGDTNADSSEQDMKGRLESESEQRTEALLGGAIDNDQNNDDNKDEGRLEDLNSNITNAIIDDSQQNEDENQQLENDIQGDEDNNNQQNEIDDNIDDTGALEKQSNDITNALVG